MSYGAPICKRFWKYIAPEKRERRDALRFKQASFVVENTIFASRLKVIIMDEKDFHQKTKRVEAPMALLNPFRGAWIAAPCIRCVIHFCRDL